MGGPGSSRWTMTVTRLTTEGLPRLDVRALAWEGALRHGTKSTVTWDGGGSIALWVPIQDANEVHLSYEVQPHRVAAIRIFERIPLTRTPCAFGGNRVWFACPGCGARRLILHALGGRFRCRACHRLAYASSRRPLASAPPHHC